MARPATPHPHANLVRVLLLAAFGLLLIGCGAGTSSPRASSAEQTAVPTPVPTTPPLALPAPDDSLPTLAALPTIEATVTPPASATAPSVAAPSRAASIDAAPAEQPETAETPESASPSAAAETPAAAPPETPTETPAETAQVQAIASVDRWTDCVLLAADTTQAAALLDPIAAGTTTDMRSVQLNALGAASVGCDMVSSGLGATDIGDYVPTATACMHAWLESSGGGSVFVGLASTGWGQPVPVWAQAHFVDAIDACFTGASFAADIMSVVSTNSSLAGAFDAACLASSFDASGTLRSFALDLADNPTTAVIPVGLSDAWVLGCANVGQMVAVAAAADGVALSGSTISCIDSELKGTGVVASLLAGTADTDAVGIATIACLTDVEAAALLG